MERAGPALAGWCLSASRCSSGSGAYFAIRLADAGLNPFASLFVSAIVVGVVSVPLSLFMLRLRNGEFAIGMW